MRPPDGLRRGVEAELRGCEGAQLRAASARLSAAYRGEQASSAMASATLSMAAERAAYLAVRMPATYAAVSKALAWASEAAGVEPTTVLDLGSGPGTAMWAAAELFPSIESMTAIEREPRLIEVGRRLATHAEHRALREATWIAGDLTGALPQGRWDLVICSYALNELAQSRRAAFLRAAWERTGGLLVIVEPGTTAGFANVLSARTLLLESGAALVAPCPNRLACPMATGGRDVASTSGVQPGTRPEPLRSVGGDWCHFAARVERTAEHRRLKDGDLGHEDEKFSYVAFARGVDERAAEANAVDAEAPGVTAKLPTKAKPPSGVKIPQARIVRHPRIFSGYVQLTLCREGRIDAMTVTRSHKDDWRRLKRLGWGDGW